MKGFYSMPLHMASNKDIEVDPEKVAEVSKRNNPRTIKELRAISGLLNFYRRFKQGFEK